MVLDKRWLQRFPWCVQGTPLTSAPTSCPASHQGSLQAAHRLAVGRHNGAAGLPAHLARLQQDLHPIEQHPGGRKEHKEAGMQAWPGRSSTLQRCRRRCRLTSRSPTGIRSWRATGGLTPPISVPSAAWTTQGRRRLAGWRCGRPLTAARASCCLCCGRPLLQMPRRRATTLATLGGGPACCKSCRMTVAAKSIACAGEGSDGLPTTRTLSSLCSALSPMGEQYDYSPLPMVRPGQLAAGEAPCFLGRDIWIVLEGVTERFGIARCCPGHLQPDHAPSKASIVSASARQQLDQQPWAPRGPWCRRARGCGPITGLK